MYKIALCEDEAVFRESQEKICRGILQKLNIEHQIFAFQTAEAFWAAFSKGARYDFIMMDIVMGGADGVKLARGIRKYDKDAAIVFITANPEYALQGYDVKALHYLMKPLDGGALEKLIAADYERRFSCNFFIVKTAAQNLRIPVRDIISFETAGRRVLITTTNGSVDCHGKLSDILESLPKENFIRCHVGYIINLRNIQKLVRTEATAVNGKVIPVSRAYSEAAQKAFLKQMWEI